MVATKIPGRVDLTDVLEDFLGDEPVGTDTDTRADRRDARRTRRESSRKVSSFDEREAAVKRRTRSEQARERRQGRDTSRANAEINREIDARDDWLVEQAAARQSGSGRLQYRHGRWFDRRRL